MKLKITFRRGWAWLGYLFMMCALACIDHKDWFWWWIFFLLEFGCFYTHYECKNARDKAERSEQ